MKKQRFRILFSKTDQMRFTSHLDLILTWERTFRRADLPLAYSEGFSPRPILNMATPLPLGYTSISEIGDFWLSETVKIDFLTSVLDNAVPPGLQIINITEITDIHAPKLPSLVVAASYLVSFNKTQPNIKSRIDALLQRKTLNRIRKNKEYDLRPLIHSLRLNRTVSKTHEIIMTLSALPGATGRPDEVLYALNLQPDLARICRTEIFLKDQ